MTDHDINALEIWQASCEGATERRLHDLTNAIDDLTTLAHSREGIRILMACRAELKAAQLKINDLLIETQPAMAAE